MKVLILCTGNSCRSKMAEGFLKSFDDFLEVYSAGTQPAKKVHPKAAQVMAELGVDITAEQPQSVEKFISQSFDYVITVCDDAKETCPVFSGEVIHRLHIGFEDPAVARGSETQVLEIFRKVRNEILVDFFGFYQMELKGKM